MKKPLNTMCKKKVRIILSLALMFLSSGLYLFYQSYGYYMNKQYIFFKNKLIIGFALLCLGIFFMFKIISTSNLNNLKFLIVNNRKKALFNNLKCNITNKEIDTHDGDEMNGKGINIDKII